MCGEVNESDWKLFRKLLPQWQEAHIEKLCMGYSELLSSDKLASDKFWELEKRIFEDKKSVGVCARMSRSSMHYNLVSLLNDGIISLEDLSGFSEDLRKTLDFLFKGSS